MKIDLLLFCLLPLIATIAAIVIVAADRKFHRKEQILFR